MNRIIKSVALLAVALMSTSLSLAQNINYNVENNCVKYFIDNVSYSFDDASQINDVLSKFGSLTSRFDKQNYLETNIKSAYKNFVPGKSYDCQKKSDKTEAWFDRYLVVDGRVRFIDSDIRNVRDLGGWNTIDGKKIKYELLYRGAQVDNEQEWDVLTSLGIKAELDLRNEEQIDNKPRIVVDGVDYEWVDVNKWYLEGVTVRKNYYVDAFKFILKEIKEDKPVYFHCKIGCDRAGTMAYLIEGTLGVCYSDLIKDFELSTLSGNPRTKEDIEPLQEYIMRLEGSNFKEKFHTYWKQAGITQEELDEFCNKMLTTGTHVHDYCTKNKDNVFKNQTGTLYQGVNFYKCTMCDRCEAPTFTITDKEPIVVDNEFTASKVVLNREFTTSWGTICLPYDFVVPSGYECYWLESVDLNSDDPKINFKPIEMVDGKYTLKAYSAYIIRYSPRVSGTPYATDFNAKNVLFKTSGSAGAKNGIMEGVLSENKVFTQEFLDENSDYIFYGLTSSGMFAPLKAGASCPPYRAYFKLRKNDITTSSAKIRVAYQEYDFEEFTDIDVIEIDTNVKNDKVYNLNGQIVDINTYKGIAIKNNKKILIR